MRLTLSSSDSQRRQPEPSAELWFSSGSSGPGYLGRGIWRLCPKLEGKAKWAVVSSWYPGVYDSESLVVWLSSENSSSGQWSQDWAVLVNSCEPSSWISYSEAECRLLEQDSFWMFPALERTDRWAWVVRPAKFLLSDESLTLFGMILFVSEYLAYSL